MRRLLLVALLVVAGATWTGKELLRLWEEPLRVPEDGLLFTVEPGDSLAAIARRLHAEGVLAHPRLLTLYGRFTGRDQALQQGEYRVPAFATARSLLDLLQRGAVVQYRVTLPEGITLARGLQILHGQAALRSVLAGPGDERIAALAQPHASAEGLFFPDTYAYTRGATDLSILRRARQTMRDVLAEEWAARATGLPYATPYEALVMASIIERETGLPQERAEIAGVFVRRLQKGMRLQTDPTVIYGLGDSFDGNLRRSHLNDASNPYNTYRHHGLPPAPIALPGRGALHAALNPASGPALFFVARGDGGHVFSSTLAEHERAVRKYQLRRRQDYRSSPGASE